MPPQHYVCDPTPDVPAMVVCPACWHDRSDGLARCEKCGGFAVERVEPRGQDASPTRPILLPKGWGKGRP